MNPTKSTTRITVFMSVMLILGMVFSLCVGLAGGVTLDRTLLSAPAKVVQVDTQTPYPTYTELPATATVTVTPVPPTLTPLPSETPTLTLEPTLPVSGDQQLNQALIDQAWSLIQQHFVDRPSINGQLLTEGAIRGMVEALGDTGHTTYLTAQEAKADNSALNGSYEGIGAYVDSRGGETVIVSPIDGSPAAKAGIKPGDVILKVDGVDISGWTLDQVTGKILGPAGTTVTLIILTPATQTQREVKITRAKITIDNVTWAPLPGTKIAHLRIAQFSSGVGKELRTTLAQIKAQGMTGIILDLRNDPGGFVNEVVLSASEFLKNEDVFLQKDAAGNVQHIPATGNGTATTIPLVVLINNGSASGSEILAGALQDAGRAKLVGETTFGTGTVLEQFSLDDGGVLLIAIDEWLTPSGRVIWHKGIVPDEEVKLDLNVYPLTPGEEKGLTADGLTASKDVQLLKAIDLLKTP